MPERAVVHVRVGEREVTVLAGSMVIAAMLAACRTRR